MANCCPAPSFVPPSSTRLVTTPHALQAAPKFGKNVCCMHHAQEEP